MMKIKFNHFERVAGMFVLACLGGLLFSLLGIAVKQGWFDARVNYTTVFKNGDGLHSGTTVQIAGLRAGSVDEVELTQDNHVKIKFSILSKFENKIRKDSKASLVRPFIIGDRIVDISLGTESELLPPNSIMMSHENMDLMTVLSGRRLGDYMDTMGGMMDSLKTLAEGFLNKDRAVTFLKLMDRIEPLVENINTMAIEMVTLSQQATRDQNLKKVMAGLTITTKEINQVLPKVREVMPVVQQMMPIIQDLIPVIKEKAPALGRDLEQLVANLALMTEQFKVVLPALSEIAPHLPRASRRAVEALDEAVVLLKAMQKSWVLSSAASDVREEEAESEKAQKERSALRGGEAKDKQAPAASVVKEVPDSEIDVESENREPAAE